MADLEAPVRLQAFEYRGRLEGGVTRPPLMVATDNDGSAFEIVVKVRNPDVSDGHFGATSLACELICAVLARVTGISVPDYFIVEISPEMAAAVPDREAGNLLTANTGENFATLYMPGMGRFDPGVQRPSVALLDALEDVLSFDGTVINGDRKASKPNLLWRGDNIFAIDHSYAIPVILWPPATQDAAQIFPDEQTTKHCAYPALKGRGRQFDRLLARWADSLKQADLVRLRSFIPASWESSPGDLGRIFRFLGERPQVFAEISAELRKCAT